MSASALQKVIVSMLFDEHFRQKIYDQDPMISHEFSLSHEELLYLQKVDIRRWGIDTKRKDRMLEGILLFAHVSVSLWVEAGGSIHHLLDFFSSKTFHQSIQNRDFVAIAFLQWLSTQKPSTLSSSSQSQKQQRMQEYWQHTQAMIPLEIACIPIHNKRVKTKTAFKITTDLIEQIATEQYTQLPQLKLASHVTILSAPASLISNYQKVRTYLSQNEQLHYTSAALYGVPEIALEKLSFHQEVYLLLENSTQGICMSEIPMGLAKLLQSCMNKNERSNLIPMIQILQQADFNYDEICDCLNGLLEDRLIQTCE